MNFVIKINSISVHVWTKCAIQTTTGTRETHTLDTYSIQLELLVSNDRSITWRNDCVDMNSVPLCKVTLQALFGVEEGEIRQIMNMRQEKVKIRREYILIG